MKNIGSLPPFILFYFIFCLSLSFYSLNILCYCCFVYFNNRPKLWFQYICCSQRQQSRGGKGKGKGMSKISCQKLEYAIIPLFLSGLSFFVSLSHILKPPQIYYYYYYYYYYYHYYYYYYCVLLGSFKGKEEQRTNLFRAQ